MNDKTDDGAARYLDDSQQPEEREPTPAEAQARFDAAVAGCAPETREAIEALGGLLAVAFQEVEKTVAEQAEEIARLRTAAAPAPVAPKKPWAMPAPDQLPVVPWYRRLA